MTEVSETGKALAQDAQVPTSKHAGEDPANQEALGVEPSDEHPGGRALPADEREESSEGVQPAVLASKAPAAMGVVAGVAQCCAGPRDNEKRASFPDVPASARSVKQDSAANLPPGAPIFSGQVQSEPDECRLVAETEYYTLGDPIIRFEKVQFICLRSFETVETGQDPSVLFSEYISPYFRSVTDSGEDQGNIVVVGDILKIFDLEFRVMAAEPSPNEIGIIDANTMVFVDWDETPEFEKIHIVPFQDTLPHAYAFDVFNDYLKPYLTKNKHMRFGLDGLAELYTDSLACASSVYSFLRGCPAPQ